MSTDSKKSKYQKLVINVHSANAAKNLLKEGFMNTNTGPSKTTSRQSSRQSKQLSKLSTPSPSLVNGAASSLPIPSLKQPKSVQIL